MRLVDSHCHLDFPEFADDLDAVVARARARGVVCFQTICTRMSEFDRVRAVAERYDDMFCSVGVHPHNAAGEPAVDTAALVAAARDPKVIGIGETGLDYHYEHSPRAAQEANFRAHAAAARETGLPLIVHTRDADDDTAAILEDEAGKGAFPGLIHCFSAGPRVAECALALGMSISFSGIVTFRNAEAVRQAARRVPVERILVETDAPFLAPVPNRGKRNEPAFVADTARVVAGLAGLPEDDFARRTTDNFFRLFARARPPAAA